MFYTAFHATYIFPLLLTPTMQHFARVSFSYTIIFVYSQMALIIVMLKSLPIGNKLKNKYTPWHVNHIPNEHLTTDFGDQPTHDIPPP